MLKTITDKLENHIDFSYSCFDRVVFRGYLCNIFVEGSVINLLRNLGFRNHSNGVLKTLTNQLNSHIKKVSERMGVVIHWWGTSEKSKYHSKIDFVNDVYKREVHKIRKSDKVICIIKSIENARTFANKDIKTNKGKMFTKMYSCSKFVSHYYIYIHDKELGLCYLKISSYLPFVCEFYMNGHNYLKQQFDIYEADYKKQDNSFVQVSDTALLESLVEKFQPSIALQRISYWMNTFFRFDKGDRSTRSKLLTHQWFTYQTEVSSNIIFKSAKFANSFFQRVLQKHHTIGFPDRLTKTFGLSKPVHNSKSTQNKYCVQACIKHWLEKNSIKCYNKSGCLLRVETTINKPDLPGLKLKKPACNLQAYYWYGLKCNSRYLNTLSNVDITSLTTDVYEKYQQAIVTEKGVRIAAPDLRNKEQLELYAILLSNFSLLPGFKNKHLREKLQGNPKTAKIAYEMRKLRERGAIKKLKNTHYYQVTEEGYVWLYYSLFNYLYFVNPLLSKVNKKEVKKVCNNLSKTEQAYSMIDSAVALITSELGLVA
jgi:hypothetical protein